MRITCIITDDEPLARRGLVGYIEKIDFLDLKSVCEDAVQLNSILKKQQVDLLFLDIEMPSINGIDFMKSAVNPPKVIFTTAYEQYALEGYELEVLDYLLKPVSFERFLKAANKAFDYFKDRSLGSCPYIFIKAGNRLEKINFEDILFVEAMENYMAIYTGTGKIVTHSTLKSLQEKLPVASFVQTHKSYIVNIHAVKAMEGNILYLNSFQVPVSKYLKTAVMERIVNNRLLKK